MRNSEIYIGLEKELVVFYDRHINRENERLVKKGHKELNENAIERVKENLSRSIYNSLGYYVVENDKIENIKISYANNGDLKISCNIIREDKSYYLESEAILAGGYNIQRLHYRYIVNSNLPRLYKSTFETYFNREDKLKSIGYEIRDKVNYIQRLEKEYNEIEIKINELDKKDEKLKSLKFKRNVTKRYLKTATAQLEKLEIKRENI